MWSFNTDTNKWVKQTDTLSKENYDNLKQDLSKVKLYSKTLSGATYLPTNNIENIYENLKYKNNSSWYINPGASVYSYISDVPSNGVSIDRDSLNTYNEYNMEYGFTLKNYFTPEKAIENTNSVSVDYATTDIIDILTIKSIDGNILVEGNAILVKNQITNVDLSFSTNPNDYFTGNYYLINNNISDITYYFYNSENGIYKYLNNQLVKQTYEDYKDFNVFIKYGNINLDKQYKLSRKLNGYFPSDSEPFEFLESKSYLVRNKVDYHNLFENNYYDILKHGTQSIIVNNYTYTIPERLIYIGDFGVILVNQGDNLSKYIYNDFKYNLKSIVEIGAFYWICGENGTILKVSKIDFSITKIDLGDEFNTLMSISFINDLKGIVVGKYNTIYSTMDGGYTWNKILFDDIINYSYNNVIYYSYDTIYISGENGVFLELNYNDISSNKWSLIQRNVIKYLTLKDQYELLDDINGMLYSNLTWNGTSSECLFFVTNNSNIIVYDINNRIKGFDFTYLSFSHSFGDITTMTKNNLTNNIIISGNDTIMFNINTFGTVSNTSNLLIGLTYSTLYSSYNNKIYDYKGQNLYNVSNIGLAYDYNYLTASHTLISTVNKKPKMLFMEYDLANKLNFFDSNYNYRLPQSVTISSFNGLTNSVVNELTFKKVDNTWLDYLIDSYKTYGVNSDTSGDTPVILSTKFNMGTSSYTFSSSEISINYNDLKTLYPIVNSSTQSRYKQFTPVLPTNAFKVLIYKYIIIFKLPTNFCKVGDVLQISSQNVEASVMINYKFNDYFYAFNDLNQSILNSINVNELEIINLNKYSNYSNLLENFEKHPISNGYKLTYDSGVFQIDGRFNNYTAYKSLQTKIYNKYLYEYVTTYIGLTGSGYVDGDVSIAKIKRPGNIYYTNNNLYIVEGGTGSSYVDGLTQSYRCRIRQVDLVTNKVSTIAGLTTSSYSGDGGLAINAGVFNPTGLTSDKNGNLYFSEFDQSRIRKISISGFISTIIGDGVNASTGDGGLAVSARCNSPYGMVTDSLGNLYFTDAGTKIRKISINGYVSSFATGFNALTYLCIDSDDNIYASDNGGHKIKKITHSGTVSNFIGNGTGASSPDGSPPLASIYYPSSVAIDSYGNFYFGEDGTNKIKKLDIETNTINTIIGSGHRPPYDIKDGDGYPPLETNIRALGLSVDDQDNFYFADYENSRIRKVKFNNYDNIIYIQDTYNLFGYTPNYSLLNYLSNINSSFTQSKKFYSMPEYLLLPCNHSGSFTDNNIYYDANSSSTFLKNKLVFGNNLKFEYDTLWLNTFVDLKMYTSSGIYTKLQMLITKKYYDTDLEGWAIEFNSKVLDISDIALNNIDIVSRNTLNYISQDLELFNNLNKPLMNRKYNNDTYNFSFYDNPIKTKINTDSYTKILLSDSDIKKYLTSIIYTDSDSNLTMNVVNVNSVDNININNSFNYSSNLALNTNNLLNTYDNGFIFTNFIGGTGSSQELNPSYIGMHDYLKIDNNNLKILTPYLNLTTVQDIGYIKINKFDPFFNYKPINLLEIGQDNMYKIPLELKETNLLSGITYSLVNIENSKPIFKLIDGLDINLISKKYHWLLEAEITNAIIGLNSDGIIWYKGKWESGRWFGGTWYSGVWISGDWYNGNWYSYNIKNTDVINSNSINNFDSVWYNGRWFGGNWNSGTWLNGRWYSGTFKSGDWFDGVWNDGKFENSTFNGGIWVLGNLYNSKFNSSNKASYWINGDFYNGEFQNGMWYNGNFGIDNKILSKFGTLSTNSRNSTWNGGNWLSGNFYSHENFDYSISMDKISTVHKYSIWKTGTWNRGNFYGGIVYNIEFLSGNWYGGIVKDIQIIGIDPINNKIILNGIFKFNIGNYVNILTNSLTSPYINLGNNTNPGRYRIALVRFDYDNNWTTLTLDYDFTLLNFTSPYNGITSSNIDTKLHCVSKFKNITWESGIWTNGIFENGTFKGGMWYDGVFTGQYGI